MNSRKKGHLLLIALITITPLLHAQQVGSNSPYGRYGYGLLLKPSVGASESMGGINYGLRRSQHVNPGNPASYSELDSLTFIFDFGISGHYSRLNDGINKQDFYNGNFDYVAIQFPLFRKMGASAGLLPYSKVGYNFGTGRSLSNIQSTEVYRGTGGLNQIYVGAAWEPLQYLSVGANLSYLFGNISYSSVIIPRSGASSTLVTESKQEFSIRDMKYDLGVQLTYPVDRTRSVILGLVYSPRLRMRADVTPSTKLYVNDPYQNPWQSPAQVLTTDTLRGTEFNLPHTLGVGITYQTTNLLVGVDGTYEGWKGMAYPDKLDELTKEERFNNVFRANAGFEYVADPYNPNFFQRVRFRGGLSYGNSYVNANVFTPTRSDNQRIGSFKELAVNVGVGLPMHDLRTGHVSMVNIGFGYIRQQPDTDFMIKQDMFKISVSMSFNEFWFFKRQFQ